MMVEEKSSKACAQCRHFHRYYVRVGNNRYLPLERGHCGEPRCRDKQADTPACGRFSGKKEQGRDGV